MKVKIYDFAKKAVGEMPLDKDIFGLEARPDLVKRVIDWQLAKAMAGTHQSKTVSDVSGTTRKPFKQKGTGNARQGSLRSVHMRGGGVSHGPQMRSHAFDLPKKVRKLGLKHALSAKYAEGKILVLSQANVEASKTAMLSKGLKNFGEGSFFIIEGNEPNKNFARASSNLLNVVLVPQIGANVYDIIKHDYLVFTEGGLQALEERLTGNASMEAKLEKAPSVKKTTVKKATSTKKDADVEAAPKKAAPKKKSTDKGLENA